MLSYSHSKEHNKPTRTAKAGKLLDNPIVAGQLDKTGCSLFKANKPYAMTACQNGQEIAAWKRLIHDSLKCETRGKTENKSSLFSLFKASVERVQKALSRLFEYQYGKGYKRMFAVLFETEEEKTFKVYADLSSAQYAAQNAVCGMGWKATIFDYDNESNTYIEFYTV